MSGPAVVVVSGRRFIAEAMAQLVDEHTEVSGCRIAADDMALRAVLDRAPASIVLVDLDAPGADVAVVASVLDASSAVARRCGFFDAFTALHAEAAFALSLTGLIELSAGPAQIVDSLLGEDRGLSVTASEGLSRRQLEQLASLTPREMEVLRHLAQGRPTKAIAHLLGVTPHTVTTHKRRTFEKLDVQSQSQAVALAASAGLVATDVT
jgi:DNA-binding NarL/FixJ family response regulator